MIGNKIIDKEKYNIICDICAKVFESTYKNVLKNRKKYIKDLCRSCKQKYLYENNIRKSGWIKYNKRQIGKTLEERLGVKKANKIKKNMSNRTSGQNNPCSKTNMSKEKRIAKAKKGFINTKLKGKTYDEVYGLKKSKEIKEKLSKANSGKNNNMFGKPSPIGSGNGWSGWYNNIYFQSILEASYIHYLKINNIKFKRADTNEFSIKYKINNIQKTYFPDFYLINSNEIIEVKPNNLINSFINKEKFKRAKIKFGDRFIVLSENNFEKLTKNDIFNLREKNIIKFTNRYEQKYKEFINDKKF